MKLLIHWTIRRWLHRSLMGELTPSQQYILDTHLEKCESCRKIALAEDQLTQNLEQMKNEIRVSPKLQEAIHARLKDLPAPGTNPSTVDIEAELLPLTKPVTFPTELRWATALTLMVVINLAVFMWYGVDRQAFQARITSRGKGLMVYRMGEAGWRPIKSNETLETGDRVRTDFMTSATLKLSESSRIWLAPGTEITCRPDTRANVRIAYGDIYVAVKHLKDAFRVATSTGMVQVMGTEFRILARDTAAVQVTCTESTVLFQNSKGNIMVPAGFRIMARANTAPSQLKAVDAAEVDILRESILSSDDLSNKSRLELRSRIVDKGRQYCFDDKDYEKALDFFRIATWLSPDYAYSYYGMGVAYLNLKQYGQATAVLQQAINLEGKTPQYWVTLSELRYSLGDYPGAEESARYAIQLDPKNHCAWAILGQAYLKMDKLSESRQAFQEAQSLKPCSQCAPKVKEGMALLNKSTDI